MGAAEMKPSPLIKYRRTATEIFGLWQVTYEVQVIGKYVTRPLTHTATLTVHKCPDAVEARVVAEQYVRIELFPGRVLAFKVTQCKQMQADIVVCKRNWKVRRL
jgi:hypothetical protein